MELKDLAPNPANPRKISDKKLEMLKKSVKEFGDLDGFIFNRKSRQLVGGHQRTKISDPKSKIIIEKKYSKPTKTGTVAEGYVVLHGERFKYREVEWNSSKEKAANIAANKGAGEWDNDKLSEWMQDLDKDFSFDIDLTMFDETERLEFLKKPAKKGLIDDDEIPEKIETKTRLGDLYQLGSHRVMCGDATSIGDVEKLMGDEKVEICFTSPPYADQREYGNDKELSTEYLASFIRSSFKFAKYFIINLGYSRKNGEVNSYWDDYIKVAKKCGLKLLSWNVWDKGECGSVGNQTAMFGISHEWIFVFGVDSKKLNRTVENTSAGEWANHNGNRQKDGTIKKQKDRRVSSHSQLKTIYECTPQKERDEIDHPARFPVRFPEGYIEAMTSIGQVIYDPFGGSGSTLIACEKTNRKCFMMELDLHYCSVIIERWRKYSGKEAYRVESNGDKTPWSEIAIKRTRWKSKASNL